MHGGNNTMKKLLLVLLSFIMLGAFTHSFASDGIQWYSLKDGMEKAKKEKKPSIVDFWYGVECPRCKRMQENIYSDPIITKKIMADFIPIKIDLAKPLTEEEDALGKKFDYKMDCLLLFLDHNGEVISDPQGKRLCFIDSLDPEWFVSYLDMIKKKYESK
jgi:thiol-disulfide isomerase/thioredoxin